MTNPQKEIRIRVLRTVDELAPQADALATLARVAVDANVYGEPWMLLPALRRWGSGRDIRVVCVFGENPACTTGPQILYGLFPLERRSSYRGMPVPVLRLLRLPYNRNCTPTIHREFVPETVDAFLNWLQQSPDSAPLIEFRFITGEGRVSQELHQQTTDRRWPLYQSESTLRALLKPRTTADAYLDDALRGKRLKEYQRLWNRLAESGRTEFRALDSGADAKPWIDAFMELEAQGWKGREGTALASAEDDRSYFEEAALAAHTRGQLMMLGLYHQDKPIALKMNFLSGGGSFAIKIAFDEAFSKFSPGVLLEMENIRRFHAQPGLAWMDSTADTEHPMINRLWLDRRTMETLLIAPGRFRGGAVVALFPLLRWLKSLVRRPKGPSHD